MSRPTTAIATDEVLDMDLRENTSDEDDGFGACTPVAASSFQGYNDGTCSTADAATDDVEVVTGTAATDGMEAVTGTLMDADANKSTTPPTLTEIWDALPDKIRRKFDAWGLGLGKPELTRKVLRALTLEEVEALCNECECDTDADLLHQYMGLVAKALDTPALIDERRIQSCAKQWITLRRSWPRASRKLDTQNRS